MVTIPTRSLPSFVQEVTLDDTPYRLVFNWNSRGEFMLLDIETAAGAMIVAGMKLALNAAILKMHPGVGLPPGEILILDPAGRNDAIALADFEARVELVYLSEAEYAAL